MAITIHTLKLYSDKNGAGKVYIPSITVNPNGGFDVTARNGPRGGTLTTQPTKFVGVDEVTARSAFDKLVKSKITGSSKYRIVEGEHDATAVAVQQERDGKSANLPVPLLNAVSLSELNELLNSRNMVWLRKMNGHRRGVVISGGDVYGFKRNGEIVSIEPPLSAALSEAFGPDAILDGELIAERLYIFDAQRIDGGSLNDLGYLDRVCRLNERARVSGLVHMPNMHESFTTDHLLIVLPTIVHQFAHEYEAQLREQSAEGIVGRNAHAPLTDGRRSGARDAVKYKYLQTLSAEVVRLNAKHSVEVGVYQHDRLIEIGSVTIPPSMALPAIGAIVEVRYLPTRRGRDLDQPIFGMIRDDIGRDACTFDQIEYMGDQTA